MRIDRTSLGTSVGVATTAVAALAAVLAIALVLLTTYLHHVTTVLGAAVESVRIAEEAQVSLLVHARAAEDRIVQVDVERDLRRKLAQAQRHVTTEDEAAALVRARETVEAYLAAPAGQQLSARQEDALLRPAYSALGTLTSINVLQARDAQQRAATMDRVANIGGITLGLLLIALVGGGLWWLRNGLLRPILALAGALESFSRGDPQARAPEQGPAELRATARKFNTLVEDIARQRAAQTAFIAGVAHDLRNPLHALRMTVSAVRPGEPLPAEARIRTTMSLVQRQIASLERMVVDLLDVVRIEAGQLRLQLETIDARALAREAVELFESVSGRHSLDLTLPEQDVDLRCDPLRIQQVLTNLISNAIKYSPEGGTVRIGLRRQAGEAIFEVVDQGIGIAKEERDLLFTPFRRVGLSAESVPGVGLGLFVVRRIVEAHQGRLSVESAVGVGSTFRVHLPAIGSRAKEQP